MKKCIQCKGMIYDNFEVHTDGETYLNVTVHGGKFKLRCGNVEIEDITMVKIYPQYE